MNANPTPAPQAAASSGFPLSAFRFRRAFTLVEMLVVIAIIGLLMAILMPAVYSAVIKARRAAVANDISQLEMSIEKYYGDFQAYPPNFFENYDTHRNNGTWAQTILSRHLKRINRNAVMAPGDPLHPLAVKDYAGNFLLKNPVENPGATETYIDAAETLVFWMAGLSSNAMYPITGPGGSMQANPSDSVLLANTQLHPTNRDARRFEFDETRLRDDDSDGFWEYYPPYPGGGSAPYVYFESSSTADPATGVPYDSAAANFKRAGVVKGHARPYLYQGTTGVTYANVDKFQIIVAGLDDDFGDYANTTPISSPPADRKLFPTGAANTTPPATQYTREDFDNMTNFSGGGTLEDRMP